MEDYFAKVKSGKIKPVKDVIKKFNDVGIKCEGEKYEDEFHLTIGIANDLLRMSMDPMGNVIFVTWEIGDGDELVMKRTPEILNLIGLSNDPNANYD